jgi:hypothetical protein
MMLSRLIGRTAIEVLEMGFGGTPEIWLRMQMGSSHGFPADLSSSSRTSPARAQSHAL